jgi:hypothetical protein
LGYKLIWFIIIEKIYTWSLKMWYLGVLGILTVMMMFPANINAKTLIDTDFGNATHEVNIINEQKNLQITGKLPDGWSDNSEWAKVQVDYQPVDEDGLKFLRINVKKRTEGWCQIAFQPLPDTFDGNYYKLSLKIRNPSRVSAAFCVRPLNAIQEFMFIEHGSFSSSWQKYSFTYPTKANKQPIGFFIIVYGEGAFDVAGIQLIEQSESELLADAKANYKESGSKNLLRISRFPLGLQSGWSLDRDNSDTDDVVINSDTNMIGPSGAPALKIKASEDMKLYTAPFAVSKIFEPHTASIYVKGDWNGKLIVLCDRDQLASKDFLSKINEWQRINITFSPRLTARAYGLRIEGKGELWIDAMQVEAGSDATSYSSQLACEVALACPEGDALPALVQFDDELPLIRFCICGNIPDAILKVKVVNLYGEEKSLPNVAIGDGFIHYGMLRYNVFPDKPYGAFRIEAHVKKPNGERISPYYEIIVHRLHRPHYWMKDAPNSPFGIHTNSTVRHIMMAKAVGVNWTRLHDAGGNYLMWYFLEPEKGKWVFRDKELNRYRKYGMKILGELGTAPKWASYYQDVGKDHSGYFDCFYQPKSMEDYANYVQTVEERYKGVIDAYDVWNEPWVHAWWVVGYDESKTGEYGGYITSKNPTADFVKLMATAYQTAKTIDDKITVLGVNTTTAIGGEDRFSGDEWTRGIVENGGLDYCDVVCYHNYTIEPMGFPDDDAEVGFKRAVGFIEEKIHKPVWMTEGFSNMLKMGSGFYNYTIPYKSLENVIDTSDCLCRHVISLLGQGVDKVFLYSMHSHSYFPDNSLIQCRALVTEEGALHPSADAYSTMAWYLEDTKFVRQLTLADGVYAYLFDDKDRSVAVLSAKYNHAEFKIPQGDDIHASDLFGNPIALGTILGDTIVYLWANKGIEAIESILQK